MGYRLDDPERELEIWAVFGRYTSIQLTGWMKMDKARAQAQLWINEYGTAFEIFKKTPARHQVETIGEAWFEPILRTLARDYPQILDVAVETAAAEEANKRLQGQS